MVERSSVRGQSVELGEPQLAAVGADAGADREQRGRRVGGVRRGAEVVPEERMLAMLPVARVARVAAVQSARELEPPVPAAGRLEQVAADRAHVPELRRRGQPARLAQRRGYLRRRLELRQRRAGADRVSGDPARHGPAHVDERLRGHDPVAEQRHELRAARERAPARECGDRLRR